MQAPASAAVVLNRAHVAQARNLSGMHTPMFGLQLRGCLNFFLARVVVLARIMHPASAPL